MLAPAALLPSSALAAPTTTPLGSPGTTTTASDHTSVNLGAVVRVPATTWATGVKFFKGDGNDGTHVGTLWSRDGRSLATATFTGETASGWQYARFAQPVELAANSTYTVSYLAPRGRYSFAYDAFSRGASLSADGTTQTRGVFTYNSRSAFPTQTYRDSNYFVGLTTKTGSSSTPGGGSTAPSPTPTPSKPTPAPTSPARPTPPGTSAIPTTPSTPTTSASRPPVSAPAPIASISFGTPTPTPSRTTPAAPSNWPASPPAAGTPRGQSLTPMAGTTITTPGTVIDGRSVTGTLTIAADNVVIRNSRVSGEGYFGIYVRSGSATITSTTVTGFENGIVGNHYTATGVELTGLLNDGFKLGDGVTVTNSWCHDLTPEPGAHADCGQVEGGVENVVVHHNWFDPGASNGNSALFIAPDLGPSSRGPLTVDDNVLGGGNFTVFCVDGDNGRYFISDITITNNHFLRDSRYGALRVNVPIKAANNTYLDTGSPIDN